ncbi:DUF1611 domain-containing protein [Hyphococcus sp. DH-69]|uniref:DUF1611 domain-containing protein n=1 Tax=Hyphococcus formosus TaxID=3143534 RepID=UPI00398AD1CD
MSSQDKMIVAVEQVVFRAPYAIYFGDVETVGFAKTGLGLIEWRRDLCIGQIRLAGAKIDGGIPDLTIEDLAKSGAQSLIIGVAPSGGKIPEAWINDLVTAAKIGLDIVSGMHVKLSTFPHLVSAATESGARLIDVRTPPPSLPIGTGDKRSGKRLLTVGTDCAVGKKYTALGIEREMRARGLDADFRATGQTGILIAGKGVPIDAVVSDFVSGAAEVVSPDAKPDHWDIIEGQGALTNPSFAGVSLGLLHGSQPDALVLCHDPKRSHHIGDAGSYPIVSLSEAIELNLILARRVNPSVRFVGVSVNSSGLSDQERTALFDQYHKETDLPVIDPIKTGAAPIVDRILSENWS